MKKLVKKIIYALNRNPISESLYKQEVAKRSKLPLIDIEALSKHIGMLSPFTSEIQPVNDWYGHATTLKKFLGFSNDYQFKFNLEHGTYLSEQIAEIELESNLPSFVTYSPYRVMVLKKISKNAYAIGPFIHYAPHYLSEQDLRIEKKRLGKTLLFFPSHSIVGSTEEYDMDNLYKKIKEISKNFDTIRVCVYWKDVLSGRHKYYQAKGFECVTAGHILDPQFLPRVKSIIHNSDLVISNDASSSLSYSIYMNKPHIIFYQRPEMKGESHFKEVMTDYWQSTAYNKVLKEFSKIQFTISKKQRELMNYYCGTNSIKTKDELLKIVKETEKIYKKSK